MKELYLKNLYFEKARKHKFNINLRIALIVLLPFIYAFLFFANPSEYDYNGNLKSLIIILIDSVILIYILISYTIAIKYYLPKKSYVELKRGNYKEIWETCDNIIGKLNLIDLHLRIYYIKTNSIQAHITLEGKSAHLFLSRGIISHSHNSLKDVESILGHEFGHIIQGDSKLFLITKNALWFPILLNNIRLIISLALALYLLAFQPREIAIAIVPLLVSLFNRRLYKGFNRLRKEAEFLADFCSVIFIENSQIAKIVENYLPDIKSPIYPSKKERLVSISLIPQNNLL